MTWWLLCTTALAATDAETLQAAWTRAAPVVAAHGAIPFDLSASDYDDLVGGEPVAHRVDTDAGNFATGAVFVDAPKQHAWIAVQDAKDRPLGREMVHETLPGETPGHRQVYMLMELPWPVADRQWVMEFHNNAALFDHTEGRVWQRRWKLVDPALAPNPRDSALWLVANEGAWTLVEAGEGTLCIFTTRTEMGGSIPAFVSRTLAISTVKKGLRALVEHAGDMATHYRGDHAVVVAPDTTAIPLH